MGRGACPQILRGICSAPVGFPVTLHYPTEWSRYFRNRLSFSGNVESCVVGHCMENIYLVVSVCSTFTVPLQRNESFFRYDFPGCLGLALSC